MKYHSREKVSPEGGFSESNPDSTTDTRPLRRSDVTVRIIDGDALVLNQKSGLIHQLNQTANFVWEHCDGQSPIHEIANQLTEIYDVDPKIALNDVTEAVRRLRELELLETPVNGN
jgi:hypothetical protein